MANLSIITGITSVPFLSPISRATFRLLHVTTPGVGAFSDHISHRKTRGLLLCPPIANASLGLLYVHTPAVFAFSDGLTNRKRRGLEVVTRAGANASSYVLAAVLPFSLLAITIFTSIKVADNLDKDFLEDVAVNQAVREAEEDGEGDDAISLDEIVQEPVLPRTRNRPKREVDDRIMVELVDQVAEEQNCLTMRILAWKHHERGNPQTVWVMNRLIEKRDLSAVFLCEMKLLVSECDRVRRQCDMKRYLTVDREGQNGVVQCYGRMVLS
ncbi:hypothetical protein V6N12_019428 [Hibiscus sabdariffa]|uniref:Uncharacterized protein n=1 Tax=Hibiscus sabdariffa TaxID=183260 RepID=A0ABR2BM91_9ROSI